MKRRAFIAVLGGAAAWPVVGRAQQQPMPVIGFLHPQSPEGYVEPMRAFRDGLKDVGYVEGENVAIEYRWAGNQTDRLPSLAADLVRRRVAVIAAPGGPLSALAAKAATITIPIVFIVGDDPVRHGLVASLARPGGNLTGINFLSIELAAKRLDLLREIVGRLARVAVLVNPANVPNTELTLRDIETATRDTGLQYRVLNADTPREIDASFESFGHERPDGLFVAITPLFVARRVQLVQLAAFHRISCSVWTARLCGRRRLDELWRESVGGLPSGRGLCRSHPQGRQARGHSGRAVDQARAGDQSSDRRRMLGLTVPDKLLASADEVIE